MRHIAAFGRNRKRKWGKRVGRWIRVGCWHTNTPTTGTTHEQVLTTFRPESHWSSERVRSDAVSRQHSTSLQPDWRAPFFVLDQGLVEGLRWLREGYDQHPLQCHRTAGDRARYGDDLFGQQCGEQGRASPGGSGETPAQVGVDRGLELRRAVSQRGGAS